MATKGRGGGLGLSPGLGERIFLVNVSEEVWTSLHNP